MRNEMLRLILLSLFLLPTFLSACTTLALSEDDQSAVYATVVRQMYTVDHTYGDHPPNWPTVYLLRATDDRAGDPRETEARSKLLEESVQEAIVAALDDLPAELIWIDDRSEAINGNIMEVKGDGVLVTLGNIYPQGGGTVHVAASIYFASTGAGGWTYILEQIDGIWKITGNTGVSWIS
jgi:hypothetical protein